jgi:glycosyltransferase involved in cell wall biosynthesis
VSAAAPVVGILPAGDLLEDWLDPLGVSIERFAAEMLGSWMFAYVQALRLAGVECVIFCVSARVSEPQHYTHAPTGGQICILPATSAYRPLRAAWERLGTASMPAGGAGVARRIPAILLRSWIAHMPMPLLLLRQQVDRYGCDALLCQDNESSRFDVCSIFGAVAGIPVFATFQGGALEPWPLRPLRRLGLHLCAGLVISAQEEVQRVRRDYGVPKDKIARIFDPVDVAPWSAGARDRTRALLAIPEPATVVAWHGSIDISYKGLDILLDAWDDVCRALPDQDLRLLVIGGGTDAAEFRRRTAEQRTAGLIWIEEWVLDRGLLADYLAAADVYAFPSRGDGFAIAPIEGMAAGLPLVTTASRGMPDLLEDGDASGGVVVPRGDVRAFSAALQRLIRDPALRRILGDRARARVAASFAPDSIGRQLRDFLLPAALQ